MTVVELTPALLLDETRFAPPAEAVAHQAVNARTPAERTAALERLTSLRRARVAVAAAVCAQEAPERVGMALWRACESIGDDALRELAAQLCAASTGGQDR
ncbi:hypothetical protein [Conexibacter sp. CPCC 206217]|uniref:hypothetical protein n=1 Tax=Conexibacter sp. CPCC 206217 TaxID=3064574 RepID=UPI0027158814|nr:hypothetical protein [Conexibacter sp. CPCC 206217]MDO8213530.1 hypothetical protein [Conexibacter sp. CPCC 206217]